MKSILLVKKLLGLVEMTSGLVNASFSLPEWQAVKMIFFAPCYSIYICDLSPLRFAVVERIAVSFPFVSRSNGLGIHSNSSGYPFQKNYHPFERLGLPLSNRSNSFLAGLLFQNNLPEQFATNLSQNVNNSSKRCFPSPCKLSRYFFGSIHLFFHNTRLSLQVLFKAEL